MTRGEAYDKVIAEARSQGYNLDRCAIEEFTEVCDGDCLWQITPPYGHKPLRVFYDPTQITDYPQII